jgi:hypothetical protein
MVAKRRSNPRRTGKPTHPVENPTEEPAEEIVDYAATADDFFESNNSDEDNNDDEDKGEDDEDEETDHDDDNDDEIGDDEEADLNERNTIDDDDDDDDESVEEEVDDVDDYDDSSRSRHEQQRQKLANAGNNVVIAGTEEPCSFDLRNLLALSSYPMNATQMYPPNNNTKKTELPSSAKNLIIPRSSPTSASSYHVNEEFLLQKAIAGCNQLISAVWQLPIERSDAGPMVVLPTQDESKIPRILVC